MSEHDVDLTHHAITRYQDRVKSEASFAAAKRELRALADQGTLEAGCPWRRDGRRCDAYLILSEGIALGLVFAEDRWVAITTLTRSGFGEKRRRDRNRSKRDRRAARRARRRELPAKPYDRKESAP